MNLRNINRKSINLKNYKPKNKVKQTPLKPTNTSSRARLITVKKTNVTLPHTYTHPHMQLLTV